MPKEGYFVKFHNGQYHFTVPLIMYADFDKNLEPIKGPTPNTESSYTNEIDKNIPSGFCVHSKFTYGKVENPIKLLEVRIV